MMDKQVLVAFAQERTARLLVNYLQAQKVQAEYLHQQSEQAHAVVLIDLAQSQLANNIVQKFIANPTDAKYQQTAWQSGQSVELNTKTSFSLSDTLSVLYRSPFTSTILFVCLLVYGLAMIGITQPYIWFKIQPLGELLDNAQWWRLIGPALIHFSLLHIAFNLLWWWTLGKQIEQKFGLSSLLILFLFSAISSNVAQLLVSGPNFGGLSGVVYALVGCVWWLGWLRPTWGISLPKPMVVFLLVWLLIGYADLLWVSMANTAHTVGLLSGCAFAWILITGQEKLMPKS